MGRVQVVGVPSADRVDALADAETAPLDARRELEEPERNMLTVDYAHLHAHNAPLAEIVTQEFYRCAPSGLR